MFLVGRMNPPTPDHIRSLCVPFLRALRNPMSIPDREKKKNIKRVKRKLARSTRVHRSR